MAKKMEWWDLPVPQIFPQTYLRVATDRGADPAALLDRAGIDPSYLDHPCDLTVLQMQALIGAVLDAVGDDGLGLDIGWNLPPTAYGSFGYALLCSETMADVLELTQRYWHLVGRGTHLNIHEQGDLLVGELTLQAPFPGPLAQLVYETTFTSLHRGFALLTGKPVTDTEVWFAFPPPPHADKARSMLGNVRYQMPVNQFRFPRALLDIRLGMHNPVGLKFALEQCAREDALIDTEAGRIVGKVRELMIFGEEGFPGLEAISRQLNMTARTLRRRLEQEGTSFKTLTEEAKRRDALKLLDDYSLDIQRVAELLGYQDPANFTRAFRQWTGQTPSQYRNTRQSA
ncbi:MAG: AraC family transcriptional regulator [Alcanivoracaceae bacterium]|jgi:AraC-like DNA-binding protein